MSSGLIPDAESNSEEKEVMIATKALISEALQLKPAERFILIEALIRSLDVPNPQIEELWALEAERRLKAYKAGKLKTVSFEDMFGKDAA